MVLGTPDAPCSGFMREMQVCVHGIQNLMCQGFHTESFLGKKKGGRGGEFLHVVAFLLPKC